jgi:prepilin-type N-terminal cleavage/methylation domain-containing protein
VETGDLFVFIHIRHDWSLANDSNIYNAQELNMKQDKGFTLVEAAVAIGIVAILSGIIIPLVMKNLNDAKYARAKNDINVIVAAIVSQQKDMGRRPSAAGGPGAGAGADGTGQNYWGSEGAAPTQVGGAALGARLVAANTFGNLFSQPTGTAASATLFGVPAAAGLEHAYKGPYLGTDVADKTDPWGHKYLIFGYNQTGQLNNGPIWVVSAGATGTIPVANFPPLALSR